MRDVTGRIAPIGHHGDEHRSRCVTTRFDQVGHDNTIIAYRNLHVAD